jgi:hypothetical protein
MTTQLTLALFNTEVQTETETATELAPAIVGADLPPVLADMTPAEVPADIREARWNQLLHEAIRQPGIIHQCYTRFYQYSIGNLMLAAWQLGMRGIEFGPLATFDQWKRKHNRHVIKGQKAIAMWMPMQVYVKDKDEDGNEVKTDRKRTIFVAKSQWFAYAQTEGEELPPAEPQDWSIARAMKELDIKELAFNALMVGVNCQGYAYKRNIAINPASDKKLATQLHEMGHIMCGHTTDGDVIADGKELTRSIKELEAEATAMLVLDALGEKDMAVYNRGYIQHWLEVGGVTEVPEDSAKRIFAAADKILKAGQLKKDKAQKTEAA